MKFISTAILILLANSMPVFANTEATTNHRSIKDIPNLNNENAIKSRVKNSHTDISLSEAQTAFNSLRIIPKNTGIIINFNQPISINTKEDPYPLTVPLAQAIADSNGELIVDKNTPISILVYPENGGAKIVAKTIIINGLSVPIKASSPIIPGADIVHQDGNDRAISKGRAIGRLAASGLGFFRGGDPEHFDRGAMLGNFVGMVTTRFRDKKTRVVQIPQNSVYVLTLEEEVHISK